MLCVKKNIISINFIILCSLVSLYLSLNDSSILLIPFKGKSLQKEEDPEDYSEPHWIDDDYPYAPQRNVYNSSTFITQWFYNGMYTLNTIGSKQIESYINLENSKLSIGKCNINRIHSKSIFAQKSYYYRPLNSETFSKIDKKTGNDIFTFVGDFSYKTNIKTGETKGNGLDFYFKEDDNDDDEVFCGNIGLNFIDLDKTNLIFQLKKKNYINKYMWTLKYQTEEDGIIILGTEPHFYQEDSFYMSQYGKMKAIQNQSPETAWSFKMDEVRIDQNKTIVKLSQNKVDFLIDRGLIIGTDEYKAKIDELIFNELINLDICTCEINKFHDEEKGTDNEYYIYYCKRGSFMGNNKYTVENTYYNSFPSLEFYTKELQMTFSLSKDHLFHEIYDRVYFLVVFRKSETANNIWKLGEPFFSHFQFTFDQEQKTVGFYNPNLERIKNSDYIDQLNKEKDRNKNNEENSGNNKNMLLLIIVIIGIIFIIIVAVGIAFFVGKKWNGIRKKRANELNDDDFDYSSQQKNNSNENPVNDPLVIN